MTRCADVIIAGGGLAGLRTADLLASQGIDVLVLEARGRVGGRTLSEPIGNGTARFDRGGQWLGPHDKRMRALVAELGIETFPTFTDGRRVLEVAGKRSTYKGLIPPLPVPSLLALHLALGWLDRMRKRVPLDAPWNAPRAEEWDGMTVETWKRRHLPFQAARELFDVAVRSIFSAEPGELSLLFLLFYLNSGGGLEVLAEVKNGAQETRFVPGSQEVSLRLARRLGERVILEAPVLSLDWGDDGVVVTTEKDEFKGKLAVLAMPPALAGRIRYRPGLPALRRQLEQSLPMGAAVKTIVRYARPFWREKGLSGEAVSSQGPLTAVFDNTSHDGKEAALMGFLLGRQARKTQDRRGAVLAQLSRLFGPEAAEPLEYSEKNWAEEEFTGGCYAGLWTPGRLTQLGPALREPIGPLHFAGSETAREHNGYMEGAVESAERACAEIRRALQRHD